MNKAKLVNFISLGGILTAITVILQSAPIFLPAFGLALSPFSTLPIALATLINLYLGIAVLLSSALILIAISIQETLILLFATGLLGLVLGALIFRKGIVLATLASIIALMIGLMILTYVLVIPGFADFTSSLSLLTTIIIYFTFSSFYVSIWVICFRRFAIGLIKSKNLQT